MQVDGDVDAPRPQVAHQPEVIREAPEAAGALGDDQIMDIGQMAYHRRRRRLDQIGDAAAGKPAGERCGNRGGEDHIADQPQADEQEMVRSQGSTEASSTSMIGMSSLMG